jgi:hypothetical protein
VGRDQLLYDLLLSQLHSRHGKLRDLNRRAMLAGVNLAQPLELASTRMRDWLVATCGRRAVEVALRRPLLASGAGRRAHLLAAPAGAAATESSSASRASCCRAQPAVGAPR